MGRPKNYKPEPTMSAMQGALALVPKQTDEVVDEKPVSREARDIHSHRAQETRVAAEESEPDYPTCIITSGEKSSFRSWVRYIKEAGVVISRADSQAIGRITKIYLRIRAAEKILAGGMYYTSKNAKTGAETIKKHPAANDLHSDEKEFRIIWGHFGLTPLARQQLKDLGGGKRGTKGETARDKLR